MRAGDTMDRPCLTLIAAVANNGVIGNCGRLPWRIRADMAFFREKTMGHPVIMGRKTFQSLKQPLAGRLNIVVSRDSGFTADGAVAVTSLDAAIERAGSDADTRGLGEIFVIGGGEIYRLALIRADQLCITHVDLAPDGDAAFPEIDAGVWRVVSTTGLDRSEGDTATGTVNIYERRGDRPG